MINYAIPITPIQIGKTIFQRKYQWSRFQFSKDTRTALLMGNVHFFEDDGQGGYGNEITTFPLVPIERNTHTEDGRDYINSSNGAYCSKALIDNPSYDGADPNSKPQIEQYTEVISKNIVDPTLIIGQFDYFESLLGSGVNILQLIPIVVNDLANRGILD